MPVLHQVIFEAMLYFGVPIAALVGVGLWINAKTMRAMMTPPKKPE